MNKLSLIGMRLPEKYKENFDVSSEGPSLVTPDEGPSLETSKFSLIYFQVVASLPYQRKIVNASILTLPNTAQVFVGYSARVKLDKRSMAFSRPLGSNI